MFVCAVIFLCVSCIGFGMYTMRAKKNMDADPTAYTSFTSNIALSTACAVAAIISAFSTMNLR